MDHISNDGHDGLGAVMDEAIAFLCNVLSGMGGTGAADKKVVPETEARMAVAISNAFSRGYFRRGEGTLYIYTGRKFQSLTEDVSRRIISEVMERMEIGEIYRVNSISKIYRKVMDNYRIKAFLPKNTIVSFRNCVLDLNDMSSYPHQEKYQTRIFLDFDYDPAARCDRWRRFLTEVVDDEESVRVLQEFMGLIFVDRTVLNVEASMFLYGTGGNGKSVVHYMMKYVLGNDNCSSFDLSQLCTHSQADYYAAACNGKLLNFASDMGDKDFSGGRFNAIVSHEPIVARQPGGQAYEAREMPLLVSNINKIPVVTDSSNGYWRRNKIIKFEKTFLEEDQDKLLKSKLRDEVSGVFNWIMEGRARIIKTDGMFTPCRKMDETVNKVRIESNSVLSFLQEMGYTGRVKPNYEVQPQKKTAQELMDMYKDYCHRWGNIPKSRTQFSNDLLMNGFDYLKRSRFGGQVTSAYAFFEIVRELPVGQVLDDGMVNDLPF